MYSIIEYNPLLDSSNLSMEDWATIAEDIGKHYHLFNGFVILHGTDTMSYTASALSFMCDNLGKTVILTGSQVSMRLSLSIVHVFASSGSNFRVEK